LLELLSIDGQMAGPLVATSLNIARLRGLAELLGVPVVHRWAVRNAAAYGGVIAWGRKPSAMTALRFADTHGLNLLRIEDGFLRSVEVGGKKPPLSLVIDDAGIYYDATSPSRLESLVAASHTESQLSRAQTLAASWRKARLSKYNFAREFEGDLPARYVLVADQTQGDASIHYGLADETSFERMLSSALAENPDCTVLLKVHPKVVAGLKAGHFDLELLAENPRIKLLDEDVHPATLIERAEAVYTVTSQLGFEGLLWGKRVRTFGMPFYAGWGLSQDELPAPARRRPVSLEDLLYAVLVDYSRYIDPETGKRCEVERLIDWMGLQRKMRERFPATVFAVGFSRYKRAIVRSYFQGSQVRFVRRADQIPHGATQVVWGRKSEVNKGATVMRLEDGFVRSVGLGADLVRPLSWVMDRNGIYYDATRPSDLELLLQSTHFDEALLARAQTLRERLVQAGLTKYNVGTSGWRRPVAFRGGISRRVILVPGQVESDASLAYGAPEICRNLDLLRSVRESNPDAYVVFKPHPDVVAGLRRMGLGEAEVALWCDEVLVDASMGDLLLAVDEVHTLTSLTGFEALLRGKKVVCHGQPFYAGWGLTEDVLPVVRRTRRLSLDELVAGVLILYPTYISRTTGNFTTPERALVELSDWRKSSKSTVPWWGGMYRFVINRVMRKA